MQLCNVKWLKAVDGNPVGREVSGVVRDELIDKWEEMGLIRVTPTDESDGTPPETALGDTQAVQQPSLDPVEGGDPFGGATGIPVPKASARKFEWAAFLTMQGIDVPADATKAEMIEAWDDSRG